MAFLPQVPNMPKDMTVEELVYCGRYPYQNWVEKNTAKEDREIVDYALHITKTDHLRGTINPHPYLVVNGNVFGLLWH